jgi:hypothetical protein
MLLDANKFVEFLGYLVTAVVTATKLEKSKKFLLNVFINEIKQYLRKKSEEHKISRVV